MDIHGLQKLTLLDYPGRVACTVFLGGCNFRCPFCHNSELLDAQSAEPVMTDGELLAFLDKRRGMLEGVCITGGEPLLRGDLPQLLREIKALGYQIKLDTNGTMPEKLGELIDAGLVDYVAMDIKNDLPRYAKTAGLDRADAEKVRESVQLLLRDTVDYEFRTTVVDELHDAESFRAIALLIAGAKRYFLQPFVDRDTVAFAGLHAPSAETLEEYAKIVRPHVAQVAVRGTE
ncbi:MAG: anaerobic ribonucleoside-triphosphate reductase activating protein [Ruminococcaceae bacterium]|nr:anaerobic ribonucleoside-triphosphate reductase activating protein [Oscillospiraceae bacterium]